MDFDKNSKQDSLILQGWVTDDKRKFDDKDNAGFKSRRDMFLETTKAGNEVWKAYPVPLFGVLTTDFQTWKKPLIPNQVVKVEIVWADSKFYLFQPATNLDKYYIDVVSAFLHVDMLSINSLALQRFEARFRTQPVIYHYNGKANWFLVVSKRTCCVTCRNHSCGRKHSPRTDSVSEQQHLQSYADTL